MRLSTIGLVQLLDDNLTMSSCDGHRSRYTPELQEVPERLTLLVRGGWWLCYAFTGILQAQFPATSVLRKGECKLIHKCTV